MANDGSSLVANSGDQTLKGNSGPWMMGDQILSIDSTKANVEYICVEIADDHPVAKQRAAMQVEIDRLRAELTQVQAGTIRMVFV